jgi:uncharacterized membrane protein YgdD (TMEM256/DUF423 family)
MPIELVTTATGLQASTESSLSWEISAVGPVNNNDTLLVFVGAVDSQKPSIGSAVFSGSALTPIAAQAMTTVAEVTGPGGISFPCGFVFMLVDPITTAGTVTGTIVVNFNEDIGIMQGMAAIFSGTNSLDVNATSITIPTQLPNFEVSKTQSTTASGSMLMDMCVSESSNHNDHDLGSGLNLFGNLFFSGPRMTTTYSGLESPATGTMSRLQAGGPFAGATLISFSLKEA